MVSYLWRMSTSCTCDRTPKAVLITSRDSKLSEAFPRGYILMMKIYSTSGYIRWKSVENYHTKIEVLRCTDCLHGSCRRVSGAQGESTG